jgi:hypothetical protein
LCGRGLALGCPALLLAVLANPSPDAGQGHAKRLASRNQVQDGSNALQDGPDRRFGLAFLGCAPGLVFAPIAEQVHRLGQLGPLHRQVGQLAVNPALDRGATAGAVPRQQSFRALRKPDRVPRQTLPIAPHGALVLLLPPLRVASRWRAHEGPADFAGERIERHEPVPLVNLVPLAIQPLSVARIRSAG